MTSHELTFETMAADLSQSPRSSLSRENVDLTRSASKAGIQISPNSLLDCVKTECDEFQFFFAW